MAAMAYSLVMCLLEGFFLFVRSSACLHPTLHWSEVYMHHMRWCLHQRKGLFLVPNPGCSFFMKVLIYGSPGVGGTFFSAMHSLCYRARRDFFSFWDSCLSAALAFDARPPPPPLSFCFFLSYKRDSGHPSELSPRPWGQKILSPSCTTTPIHYCWCGSGLCTFLVQTLKFCRQWVRVLGSRPSNGLLDFVSCTRQSMCPCRDQRRAT